jgi:hypothetical protein
MAAAWGVLPNVLRDLPAGDYAFNVACYRARMEREALAIKTMKPTGELTPVIVVGGR